MLSVHHRAQRVTQMLKAKCLAQGSSGNCWILSYDLEMLILDAGIKAKAIKQGIDYNLMGVQGVLVTHSHSDHSMAVEDLRKMGLPMFVPFTDDRRSKTCGHFKTQAFSVPHSVPCYGFLIKVEDRKIMYVTDYEYFPYSAESMKKIGLTDIICEVNYQDKYLDLDAHNILHKSTGHCSLDNCIETVIKPCMTDDLQNVIITHLGIDTCDGNECVSEIKKVVPENVNVDYARANETYILKGGM